VRDIILLGGKVTKEINFKKDRRKVIKVARVGRVKGMEIIPEGFFLRL